MNILWAIMKKEGREIWRDPLTVGIAILLPLIMLFLFGYAISLDVQDIPLAVYDLDRSRASRDYLTSFLNSGYFRLVALITDPREITTLLDQGVIRLALVIPPEFSERLAAERQASVQAIIDGSFPTMAMITANYTMAITQAYSNQWMTDFLQTHTTVSTPDIPTISIARRVWYNASLKSVNYIVPGLFAVILMAFPPLLTTLAVVRERERGSIQQIFVSPVHPWQFILGKLLPYTAIAFGEMLLVFLAALFWFQIPFRGSLGFLLGASLLYVLCTVSIGLCISTLTRSQLVAILLAMIVTVMPSFLFSGFLYPIFTMPVPLQWYTFLFPARYFITISRGIFLKGVGWLVLWPDLLLLAGYTGVMLIIAVSRFKKKL